MATPFAESITKAAEAEAQRQENLDTPKMTQDKPSAIGPVLAALLGGAGDVATTQVGLARGGREINPLLPQNRLGNGLMLGGGYVGAALLAKYLNDHGHPNWAKAIGYGAGADGTAFALHNLGTIRDLKR